MIIEEQSGPYIWIPSSEKLWRVCSLHPLHAFGVMFQPLPCSSPSPLLPFLLKCFISSFSVIIMLTQIKRSLIPYYCDCAHPCMSFSANPFKTRNFITNYFCLVKQKGKMNKSFVFGWTSEASVSTKEWGWEFKKVPWKWRLTEKLESCICLLLHCKEMEKADQRPSRFSTRTKHKPNLLKVLFLDHWPCL